MYQPDPDVVRAAVKEAVTDWLDREFGSVYMPDVIRGAVKDAVNESADWVFNSFADRKRWAVEFVEALGR